MFSRLMGDDDVWEPKPESFYFYGKNHQRRASMVEHYLDRAARANQKRQRTRRRNKQLESVEERFRIMKRAGFKSTPKHSWIDATKRLMRQIMEGTRWRPPTLLKPELWSFSLQENGGSGPMFKSPLMAALYIADTWAESWGCHIVPRLTKSQPLNTVIEDAVKVLYR